MSSQTFLPQIELIINRSRCVGCFLIKPSSCYCADKKNAQSPVLLKYHSFSFAFFVNLRRPMYNRNGKSYENSNFFLLSEVLNGGKISISSPLSLYPC